MLFFAATLAAIIIGWQGRELTDLTAEQGLGYALGIAGGVMMLALLLYPARKKWNVLRGVGPVKWWFRAHMTLGILGPLAILYHANFHWGSLNSNVALISMLTVAGSGVIGRYFYAKIHNGLYGGRATLQDLGRDSGAAYGRLAAVLDFAPGVKAKLHDFDAAVQVPVRGILHGAAHVLWFAFYGRWLCWRLRAQLTEAMAREARRFNWPERQHQSVRNVAHRYLNLYFHAARRVAELGFYERMFAAWHVLHMPLFVMLLISGIVHVVAVHAY